jgi:hypothetical protein
VRGDAAGAEFVEGATLLRALIAPESSDNIDMLASVPKRNRIRYSPPLYQPAARLVVTSAAFVQFFAACRD